MGRTASPQIPMEFVGRGVMRWEEVPATVRDRVRKYLAGLLRHAAGGAVWMEGSDDE
jgi:hypothetical protein